MTEHENWWNLTLEEVIDPELPICDAHHHLRYVEGQRYLATDFMRDMSGGHNVKSSVVIQSYVNLQSGPGGMKPVEETRFFIKDISVIESDTDIAAGIVGFADLRKGNVIAPILESHMAAGEGRFRGIRFIPSLQPGSTEPADAKSVLSDPGFQEGIANLQKLNLTYDLMISPHHFKELAELAKKFADLPIIINHIGWATSEKLDEKQRAEGMDEWRQGVSTITPYDNVYMKLGGLGMSVFGFGWNERATPPGSSELAETLSPYYLYCIEHLGTKRCMFESNFPVDKESYSYTIIWNAFKRITGSFSDTERCDLFHDTAAMVYKLRAYTGHMAPY